MQSFAKFENKNKDIEKIYTDKIEIALSNPSNNRAPIAVIMSSLFNYNYYNYTKM